MEQVNISLKNNNTYKFRLRNALKTANNSPKNNNSRKKDTINEENEKLIR